jgi:hypothetical protein
VIRWTPALLLAQAVASCSFVEPLDILERADASMHKEDAAHDDDQPDSGMAMDAAPGDVQLMGTTIRVACGRTTPYRDHDGNIWSEDRNYVGGIGVTRNPTVAISNTLDAPLYNSERLGFVAGNQVSFQYMFTVAVGSYDVTLKFAETDETAPGARVFNVSINGVPQLTSFDIYQSAGGTDIALDRRFQIDATSGTIDILVDPVVDFPRVNAIEVLPR